MEVQAQARWVRTGPRKVRLVAASLRGLPVAEALAACQFMPRAAARDVAKVIKSAQANAEHNFNLAKDDLVLKELRVEGGPMLKRGQPRAMGRLFSVYKRMSHITAVVEDRPGIGAQRRRTSLPRAPQAPVRRPAPQAPSTADTGEPASARPEPEDTTQGTEAVAAAETRPRRSRTEARPAKGETKAARGEAKAARPESTEGKTGKTRKERKSS
jgi:large subunit ribosomal protein L22